MFSGTISPAQSDSFEHLRYLTCPMIFPFSFFLLRKAYMQPLRRVLAGSGIPNHTFQLHLKRRRGKLKATIVLLLQIPGRPSVQEDCLVAGISLFTPSCYPGILPQGTLYSETLLTAPAVLALQSQHYSLEVLGSVSGSFSFLCRKLFLCKQLPLLAPLPANQ